MSMHSALCTSSTLRWTLSALCATSAVAELLVFSFWRQLRCQGSMITSAAGGFVPYWDFAPGLCHGTCIPHTSQCLSYFHWQLLHWAADEVSNISIVFAIDIIVIITITHCCLKIIFQATVDISEPFNRECMKLKGVFYHLMLIVFSPTGASLDVKKSSYKKLSKFLAAMQRRGFVQVKELSKGVESIVSIDRDHSELVLQQSLLYVRFSLFCVCYVLCTHLQDITVTCCVLLLQLYAVITL